MVKRRTLAALAVLLGDATAAAAQGAVPVAASGPSELEQAQQLIRQGRSAEALPLLDPIIAKALTEEAKDPRSPCPAAAVAILQRMLGKGVTVTLPNDYCQALQAKGYALGELKRFPEAEQTLGILYGHDPQNPPVLIEYAFAVRANGGTARALPLYRQAEQLAARLPNRDASRHLQAVALRGEGYVLADLGHWDEAVAAYRRSQKFEPNDPIAAHELGWIAQNRPH